MKNAYDALIDYAPGNCDPENLSAQELSLMAEDSRDELKRVKKKLKRAKKKGKGSKKLKRKIENLKKRIYQLERLLYAAKQQPVRGRWDGLIEQTAPELIKLVKTVVRQRRASPQKK